MRCWRAGIELSIWRIHRRIGMSGGLFTRALLRETGREYDPDLLERLRQRACRGLQPACRATCGRCRGRVALLRAADRGRLCRGASPPAGGWRRRGRCSKKLGVPDGVPIITRDMVRPRQARPGPVPRRIDRLGVDPASVYVVGDSVWDLLAARRAGTLGHRPAVGRLRHRGAGAGRRLPGLRRPGDAAQPPRRAGRAGGLIQPVSSSAVRSSVIRWLT